MKRLLMVLCVAFLAGCDSFSYADISNDLLNKIRAESTRMCTDRRDVASIEMKTGGEYLVSTNANITVTCNDSSIHSIFIKE